MDDATRSITAQNQVLSCDIARSVRDQFRQVEQDIHGCVVQKMIALTTVVEEAATLTHEMLVLKVRCCDYLQSWL